MPWKIAVKCVGPGHEEREGCTPALALPLLDGDVYYMLDDFNHHREAPPSHPHLCAS